MSEQQFFFRIEEITANKAVIPTAGCVQVGFVNIGDSDAILDAAIPLRSVPDPIKYLLPLCIHWFPIAANERDATRHSITFTPIDAEQIKKVLVYYKFAYNG